LAQTSAVKEISWTCLAHADNLPRLTRQNLKRFSNAAIVIAGIELMHRIRKEQFDLRLIIKDTAAPAVWNAVLSA
jgi:hypothetical protein